MPIANYTTTVSEVKTAGEVQGILAGHGARSVMMQYDKDGKIEALAFQVDGPEGPLSIRLPVQAAAALQVLKSQRVPRRYQNLEQARRVAWRIVRDWVRAQMALLETEMVRMEEIFLPYLIINKDGATLYEIMAGRGFELPEGRG